MPKIAIGVVPVIMLLTASPPPLNGTRSRSMPCVLLKSSTNAVLVSDARHVVQRLGLGLGKRDELVERPDLERLGHREHLLQVERLGDRHEALHGLEARDRVDHGIGDHRLGRDDAEGVAVRRRLGARARADRAGRAGAISITTVPPRIGPSWSATAASTRRSGRPRPARRSPGSAGWDSPARRRARRTRQADSKARTRVHRSMGFLPRGFCSLIGQQCRSEHRGGKSATDCCVVMTGRPSPRLPSRPVCSVPSSASPRMQQAPFACRCPAA